MEESKYKKIMENITNKKNFGISGGLLYRKIGKRRLQVIRDFEFEGIMYVTHDNELSAHFGIEATYEKVYEKYWWNNMKENIEEYVKLCWKCQMRGRPQGKNELHPIE